MAKTTYRQGSYDDGVFKKGKYWHYTFRFNGVTIQESSRSTSKTVAREAMASRRRAMEMGFSGIRKRERMPLLRQATERWLETKATRARNTYLLYSHLLKPIKAE